MKYGDKVSIRNLSLQGVFLDAKDGRTLVQLLQEGPAQNIRVADADVTRFELPPPAEASVDAFPVAIVTDPAAPAPAKSAARAKGGKKKGKKGDAPAVTAPGAVTTAASLAV